MVIVSRSLISMNEIKKERKGPLHRFQWTLSLAAAYVLLPYNSFASSIFLIQALISYRLWVSHLPETKRKKNFHFKEWLKIRDNWFLEQQKEKNTKLFSCALCNRRGLDPFTKDKNHLATIDHIKPVSKFPDLWNCSSNFQIACYPCNTKKGNSHQEQLTWYELLVSKVKFYLYLT